MNEVVMSAPGKMLLLGGYAILDRGRVGYTIGVNQRVYVRVKASKESGRSRIILPDFRADAVASFDGLNLKLDSPAFRLVRAASEATLRYLTEHKYKVQPFELTTHNDPGFTYRWGQSKSGLGSSSAVTVATVGSLLEFNGFSLETAENRETAHKLAQLSHVTAQKSIGSGFDVATCFYGEHVYERYSPDLVPPEAKEGKLPESKGWGPPEPVSVTIDKPWNYLAEPLPFPENAQLAICYTGRAASTKEMVKRVNEWRSREPQEYEKRFGFLDGIHRIGIAALKAATGKADATMFPDDYNSGTGRTIPGPIAAFASSINLSRKFTREIGEVAGAPIEPPWLTRIIDTAIEAGAIAAKSPGAGGGDSVVALCLDDETRERIFKAWETLEVMDESGEQLGIKPYRELTVGNTGGLKKDSWRSEWDG